MVIVGLFWRRNETQIALDKFPIHFESRKDMFCNTVFKDKNVFEILVVFY